MSIDAQDRYVTPQPVPRPRIKSSERGASRARLNWGRLLLTAGLSIGLVSWQESVNHIGDAAFVLPPDAPEGPTHVWYHVFREVCGDAAKMAAFLMVFFGPDRYRTPETWWIVFALMIGYYGPFWAGEPIVPELSAPNRAADAVHAAMAGFSLAALFVSRAAFRREEPGQL
jgi:hypothetical protein